MSCTECSCQCGNELEKIERMKEKLPDVKRIMLNQATYEAISGEPLTLAGLVVEIRNDMQDKQYMIV